ncbi:MAG: methyltetrahydrofolate--corrinoid methyltransferase [Spirochaetaceae bacterium]|nr:MAG: methyltetrahydrofolate--corrinoid methyltransferase [Spirochaetaceae bacterium]
MKIIGEKINGTLKKVRRAIEERDSTFIGELALSQVSAGADWLDINAGTAPDRETEDLLWLVECVQDVTDIPLCLDSANPEPLTAAAGIVARTPMINSISLEQQKIREILPVVREYRCDVIALAMDDGGIPASTEERLRIIHNLMEEMDKAGVTPDRIYLDPLVMGIATNTASGGIALETIRSAATLYEGVHFCAGLSNISFGLPQRSLINQVFLTLAIEAGLDTAILNPLDRELRGAILATELVLGRDRHCQRYTRASKNGLIGRVAVS